MEIITGKQHLTLSKTIYSTSTEYKVFLVRPFSRAVETWSHINRTSADFLAISFFSKAMSGLGKKPEAEVAKIEILHVIL